ncbi:MULTISPECIES: hypothetical protein [Burkholderia]|uniref:Peptidase M24 n=1 Tax=Burkholderia aenigmatica TaxID=2015348 RepID=A0ABY6YAH3_9BURK|nr:MULTISPECIES: hypothetical protein [Burkholderia]VWD50708.1 peptidase M24 [Burkholderia aenigmatica]VWD65287.1 peptidase M24 [Burkholderia aenigmatica]
MVHAQTPGERVCIDIIDDVRMIKCDYEIGRHVYACGIAADAHNLLLSESRSGLLDYVPADRSPVTIWPTVKSTFTRS